MPKWKRLAKKKFSVEGPKRVRKYRDAVIVKRLFSYVNPYKRRIYYLLVLTLVTALLNLVYPFGVMFIMEYLGPPPNFTMIVSVGFGLLALTLGNFFVQKSYNFHISMLGVNVMNQLRQDCFDHLQVLSYNYFVERPAGKIMSTLTNDVGAVNNLISSAIINVIRDLVSVVGSVIAMLFLSPELSGVLLFVFALGAPIFYWFAKKSREFYRQTQRTISSLTGQLQESISGSRTIKAFVTEEENIAKFQELNVENLRANISAGKMNAYLQPVIQLLIALALGIVIYAGTRLITTGRLGLPQLVAYFLLASQFAGPVGNLTNFYQTVQLALAGGERVLTLLDTPPDVEEKESACDLPPIRDGVVEFRDVTFEYEKGVPVLKDINLKTERHQRVALVGFTGAGKTTFVSLLMRFYDPKEGQILVDGHDLRDVTLGSLQAQLGVVLQDTYLFSGTVMENIRFGRLDATDEEVVEAAKVVGAHEFIIQLDEGYQTQVQEEGRALSVGQRQLIAFARALLRDPPLLILDEATSSIDPYSELLIQQALEKLLRGRTSFSIAHRLSTVINSDLILVMDHGRIVERGTHEELVAVEGGLYRRLYEMQFKDAASPEP
ncbi:MAG: ABC transporter ATP-binding protein [Promethearchaeota archaeon]